MATLKEIAREAQVSESLVSRFFNGDPTLKIREDKRDRILSAREKLGGYRANQAAFSLAKGRAHNFVMPVRRGYSLDWIQSEIGQDVTTQAMETALKAQRFRLSLTFFQESDKHAMFAELIQERSYYDGFIMRNGVADPPLAKLFKENRVVHVSQDIRDEALGLNVVCDNAVHGMQQAFEHLAALGHQRIGYLGMVHPDETSRREHPGIRETLFNQVGKERGVPRELNWDCTPTALVDNAWLDVHWHQRVRQCFTDFLSRPAAERGTALIAQDDRLALEFIDVMQSLALTPGKDVSIIGYDNLEDGVTDHEPLLTTLETSRALIGRRTAEMLLEQVLQGRDDHIREHIAVDLIVRGSTGPAPKK